MPVRLQEAIAIALASPWLSRQSPEFQKALCAILRLQSYSRGSTVFHADDEARNIVCLVAGSAATSVIHPSIGPLTAVLWRPGQWFGQSPCLGRRSRMMSVHARVDSQFVSVSREDVAELLKADITFSWAFFDLLVCDFEAAVLNGSDMFIPDAGQRLCARLLTLAGRSITALPKAPVIIHMSKEELASASAMSRQTAQMLLNGLAAEGICRLGYREIEILDVEALLRKLAS